MAANNNKLDYIINYIASRQIAKDLLDKIEKKGNTKILLLPKFKIYKSDFEKKRFLDV